MAQVSFREGLAMRVRRTCRLLPEALWRRWEKLLPKYHRSSKGGRPRLELRRVAEGIYFVLRTGCQWKLVPAEYGSGSSLHRYFQEWVEYGVFRKLWKRGLIEYERCKRVSWRWQCLDTAMTKAPLGGEKNRAKPHRSQQTGSETLGADRRSRGRPRHSHWTSQPA